MLSFIRYLLNSYERWHRDAVVVNLINETDPEQEGAVLLSASE
jgi:hypothetical protein